MVKFQSGKLFQEEFLSLLCRLEFYLLSYAKNEDASVCATIIKGLLNYFNTTYIRIHVQSDEKLKSALTNSANLIQSVRH